MLVHSSIRDAPIGVARAGACHAGWAFTAGPPPGLASASTLQGETLDRIAMRPAGFIA
jgi:hypothetical protein